MKKKSWIRCAEKRREHSAPRPANAATMPKALPPGGKSMLWRKLATDTEGEATVKGLSVWPIEGWTVSKHTKKDSSSYFL